ncbi:glycine-rich RNA-binding protein 4, mitochondrial-like [Silene latifolia]|uniref:glycine-rich RNA-binding protein 4, mitochondrial-like n=1 Tax=Silene latifolia TaxID=37657 RepID=UPI003D776802
MALFSQVGSILKQSISQNSASSMLNSVRYITTRPTQLFVVDLPYAIDETSLKEAFSKFGEVKSARVILDPETRMSRGYGFVTFADAESAETALVAMDGKEFHGRSLRVSIFEKRPRIGGYGGRGYQGGGGFGGGGRGSGQSSFKLWRRKKYGLLGGGYGGGGYQEKFKLWRRQ